MDRKATTMDSSLLSFLLASGFFAIACCVLSLLDHSKKGQVLFRLWR